MGEFEAATMPKANGQADKVFEVKIVAIKDGEVLDSKETEWDVTNVDPQYHFDANADGNLMGWINELCYIKLDMNPDAPDDPWTKDPKNHRGISHMYLGQRGATKNAHKICEVPENYKYPHPDMCTIKHEDHAQCLKLIQQAMKDNPEKASELYKTCGVYLGYGLAQYVDKEMPASYEIEHVMILGRVSKGTGGDLMLKTASEVLEKEFPDLPKITFHTADDHFKAVGQCIAAAALPKI